MVYHLAIWDEYRSGIIGSGVFHILLLLVIFTNLSTDLEPPVKHAVPDYVKAVVLERPPVKKNRPVQKPKPKIKPVVKEKAKERVKPKPKPPKKAVVKVAPPEIIIEPDFAEMMQDEAKELEEIDRQRLENELKLTADRQKEAEMAAAEESRHLELVSEYQTLIRSQLQRAWNVPPSARNGMQTSLAVHLLPGGEILSIRITQSSGDNALDRSAENAFHKLGVLHVPDDPVVFDRYFRKFTFIFRPEDLRL